VNGNINAKGIVMSNDVMTSLRHAHQMSDGYQLKYQQIPSKYLRGFERVTQACLAELKPVQHTPFPFYEEYLGSVEGELRRIYGLPLVGDLILIVEWAFICGFCPIQFVDSVGRCLELEPMFDMCPGNNLNGG
jgi:hypothetical protein|tara:strand:+ start:9 stop:407 length:399 start_codon:yes stop_codon:yes gene_type:complete